MAWRLLLFQSPGTDSVGLGYFVQLLGDRRVFIEFYSCLVYLSNIMMWRHELVYG